MKTVNATQNGKRVGSMRFWLYGLALLVLLITGAVLAVEQSSGIATDDLFRPFIMHQGYGASLEVDTPKKLAR